MTASKTTKTSTEKAKIKDLARKLLTQAEDPAATAEEAQAFAAKAADLLARHGLDVATVKAEKDQKPEAVSRFNFTVSGQGWHGKARADLVYSVAEAFGCQACTIGNKMNGADRLVAMVGTAAMIDALKLLVPSILLQAETSGMRARKEYMASFAKDAFASSADRNIESRTFYRSFLAGYGRGVAEKIRATRNTLADEVKGKPGELVLASDAERIKAAFERMFPKLTTGRADKVSMAGLVEGVHAGRTADTGQTKVNRKSGKAIKG